MPNASNIFNHSLPEVLLDNVVWLSHPLHKGTRSPRFCRVCPRIGNSNNMKSTYQKVHLEVIKFQQYKPQSMELFTSPGCSAENNPEYYSEAESRFHSQ